MSDTPRTDAVVQRFLGFSNHNLCETSLRKLASDLERELAERQERCELHEQNIALLNQIIVDREHELAEALERATTAIRVLAYAPGTAQENVEAKSN